MLTSAHSVPLRLSRLMVCWALPSLRLTQIANAGPTVIVEPRVRVDSGGTSNAGTSNAAETSVVAEATICFAPSPNR